MNNKKTKNISAQKLGKHFKIIFLIWLGLLAVSAVFYFIEIDICLFSTFFLGAGLGIWFLFDEKLLQSDKHYIYCLLISIAFLAYSLLLKHSLDTKPDTEFAGMIPLCLLAVQRPTRLLCKHYFKQEPIFRGSLSGGDFIYTIVLSTSLFGLPLIIMMLLK